MGTESGRIRRLPDALIDHCRSLIASYKKPKHVRFIDALPRTGTGKVQKQKLRAELTDAMVDAAGG